MTAIRTLAAAAFLLFWAAVGAVQAQESVKRHRVAIIVSRPVALIDDSPVFQTLFEELRRLGLVEGQNLTIERYSGGGRPEGYADLARQVVNRSPEVIVVGTNPGDIPIYQSTKFDFVINLKTAKARGLTFSPALLATADEVIE